MLSGLLLLCLACSKNETPKGFEYTVVRKGDGNTVKPGEFLVLNMLFKDKKTLSGMTLVKVKSPLFS